MKAKYKHTNIIAKDWKRLVSFYEDVFGCTRKPPERHLSGQWIEKGTGVEDAHISGVHLGLPGYEKNGPTLEVFGYVHNEKKLPPAANREGFAHIAFEVEDVAAALVAVLEHGGGAVGEIVSHEVKGAGLLTFVYATDPEGNIIELQSWE
ncbi:MAG: VOC family protein [Candidatus Latescibacteria bacterium]|nr:VOC family protein [Candidatus Latescibacterota bacterium]